MDWTVGVRFLRGTRFFSSPQRPSGSGVQGRVALSPEVKRPEREYDHSPPSSAEVKNYGATPPSPIGVHGVVLNYLSIGTTLPVTVAARSKA
jgi:hypothetical protein